MPSAKKTVMKIIKDYVLVLDSSDSFGDTIVGGVSYFSLILYVKISFCLLERTICKLILHSERILEILRLGRGFH